MTVDREAEDEGTAAKAGMATIAGMAQVRVFGRNSFYLVFEGWSIMTKKVAQVTYTLASDNYDNHRALAHQSKRWGHWCPECDRLTVDMIKASNDFGEAIYHRATLDSYQMGHLA